MRLLLTIALLLPFTESKTVMLIGGSGAVGGGVLRALANSDAWDTVYLVGRRPMDATTLAKSGAGSARFEQIVEADLLELESSAAIHKMNQEKVCVFVIA